MINTLISAAIGATVLGAAVGHLLDVMQTYSKIQTKFTQQQKKLIARQLIGKDLFLKTLNVSSCKVGTNMCSDKLEKSNIMPLSDILILHGSSHDIIYSLRKSVIFNSKPIIKYALYRDDTLSLPQAVVENVKNLQVQIFSLPLNKQKIIVTVEFFDNNTLEITCTLPH